MKLDENSELLIRRYLLSSVSEEERVEIETRLMSDDDFFQQINLVEDELVEEYLDEELIGADRSGFEHTFLCAPERQYKLRFTKALRVYATNAVKVRTSHSNPAKHPWYEPFLGLFNVSRPVLAYSLAAALLMLAGAGAWMLVQMGGLKGQISGLQAQQQNSGAEVSRLHALYEMELARADQMASLLQQELGKRVLTQMESWFTITPGAQRSAQPSKQIEIPKGAILIGLNLDLAENWKEAYRAVLLSEGKEILSRSNLKASISDKEIVIRFSVPATDLPSGYCEIRLYGSDENEVLETYYFRVTKTN